MPLKVFHGPGLRPHKTWRSRLITWFMGGPQAVYMAWGLHSDGRVRAYITTDTGEIIAEFKMGAHMFPRLLEQMKEVEAHRGLIK